MPRFIFNTACNNYYVQTSTSLWGTVVMRIKKFHLKHRKGKTWEVLAPHFTFKATPWPVKGNQPMLLFVFKNA